LVSTINRLLKQAARRHCGFELPRLYGAHLTRGHEALTGFPVA